jgi:hypothetical protein
MAAEDVARALMALDDADVRRRVAAGDFGALGALVLTPAEEALVSGATPELPDGHPSKVFVAMGEVAAHRDRGDGSGYWPAGTAEAISYVRDELGDPRLQAEFAGWTRSRRDQFP